MKKHKLQKCRFCLTVLLMGFLIPVLSGCNWIHDDLEACPTGLRLKLYYDYNMKFSDAFPSEVKNVSVYVFDSDSGAPVDEIHQPVGQVKEHEFEINLDYLEPGNYDFVVWCYGDSKEHFSINPQAAAERLLEHHTCLLSEDPDKPGHQSNDIGRLYHAIYRNAKCIQDQITTYELNLVKDTNVMRLVLNHIDGTPLDPKQFDITITSDNGHLGHDNLPIAGHQRIYHPWSVKSGVVGYGPSGETTKAITSASSLVAEHTISRIMKGKELKLHVKNSATGEDIINLPIQDYLLLVKGSHNQSMSDQEYLDRQDEYNMVFFLDSNLRWIQQYIYINSWRIVLQEEEL